VKPAPAFEVSLFVYGIKLGNLGSDLTTVVTGAGDYADLVWKAQNMLVIAINIADGDLAWLRRLGMVIWRSL